ncbi:MAG: alpha-amylase family glycosyl hydrolase [Eubacteriales bacterium]
MDRIFEINTRVWLNELRVKLGDVPGDEIRKIKSRGFDAVWLMGVWKSSAKGRDQALQDQNLLAEISAALPGFQPDDVASSPYAICGYEIDPLLGSDTDICKFRRRLNDFGLKLILDFVPNHLALDHPLVTTEPELFINGTQEDLIGQPQSFFSPDLGRTVLAYGKDPYYPAWSDVVQLNYFNPDTRRLMHSTMERIAELCDGVRCDMAMLVLNSVHKKIWGDLTRYPVPASEFWTDVIRKIKIKYADFIFIAEAYWGLDSDLISAGFDFIYDKGYYDDLRSGNVPGIKYHLKKDANNALNFIENHDEDRAAMVFGNEKSMAAAVLLELSSGLKLIHQGQMEGYLIKQPLRLIKSVVEPVNKTLNTFYRKLTGNFDDLKSKEVIWEMIEPVQAWDDNQTHHHFLAFYSGSGYLAAVNYSGTRGQCYLRFDTSSYAGVDILFHDLMGSDEYVRPKQDVESRGLYLDIPPYAFHLFRIFAVRNQS